MELYTRAADLGIRKAHHNLASLYHKGGDLKHYEPGYGRARSVTI